MRLGVGRAGGAGLGEGGGVGRQSGRLLLVHRLGNGGFR
jgi:hypothetical protein